MGQHPGIPGQIQVGQLSGIYNSLSRPEKTLQFCWVILFLLYNGFFLILVLFYNNKGLV
jgi:hypothetical protein